MGVQKSAAFLRARMGAQRNIARATGDIDKLQLAVRAHIKRVNHAGFPKAMQPAGHDIIHHIIFIGDRVKHAAHKPLLVIARNLAKTEINGFGVLARVAFGFFCPAHKSCLLSIALLPDAARVECAATIAYQAC